MLILRETRYLFGINGEGQLNEAKGGKKPRRKKQGSEMEEVEHLEKDHDVNFLCYTTRGIIIVTREEMFVLYIS